VQLSTKTLETSRFVPVVGMKFQPSPVSNSRLSRKSLTSTATTLIYIENRKCVMSGEEVILATSLMITNTTYDIWT
jgi:hypothetical protein